MKAGALFLFGGTIFYYPNHLRWATCKAAIHGECDSGLGNKKYSFMPQIYLRVDGSFLLGSEIAYFAYAIG